jgi:hypothetical protein
MPSDSGIGMIALTMVKEIVIAIGLGVLSITLTLKDGKVNRLAALGIMIVLSVVPDILIVGFLRLPAPYGVDLQGSWLPYFRTKAGLYLIQILVGYILGAALLRRQLERVR